MANRQVDRSAAQPDDPNRDRMDSPDRGDLGGGMDDDLRGVADEEDDEFEDVDELDEEEEDENPR